MDKYLVQKPRVATSHFPKKKEENHYTQATIESLQGVVVVEDIWRFKSILTTGGQSRDNLVQALHQLSKKIPSRTVMKTTKIGHTVNRLTKHKDREVAQLAAKTVKRWKEHFESKLDRPMIDVKCDTRTEKLRTVARNHLSASLGLPEKHLLAENIEREAFCQNGRLANNAYKRTMRALVFTLKHHPDVRAQLLEGSLQVPSFVTQNKKNSKCL